MTEVTRILDQIQQGDARAAAQLLPLVYEKLRKLAAQKMVQESPGQTLTATDAQFNGASSVSGTGLFAHAPYTVALTRWPAACVSSRVRRTTRSRALPCAFAAPSASCPWGTSGGAARQADH